MADAELVNLTNNATPASTLLVYLTDGSGTLDYKATLANLAASAAFADPVALKAPLASPTFTGVATTPALAVSGLTGAVSATRYVGGTAALAPTTGTFAIGDFVVSATARMWVCTVAGTPGTWVEIVDSIPELAAGDGVTANTAAGVTTVAVDATVLRDTEYDANTVLVATTDNTPVALTLAASTILARLATGDIVAATPAQLRTLLALVVGTDVQAFDADLSAIAALTSAADKVPYSTGAQAWALATQTAFARTLLDDVDAAAARATLGVPEAFAQAVLDTIQHAAIRTKTVNQYYYNSYDVTSVAGVLTQSRLLLSPVVLAAGTIDRIGCDVTTGVASSVIRLGVYGSTADMPGALIAEATSTYDASVAAVANLTISAVIPSLGVYWLALCMQGAVATLRTVTSGPQVVPMPLGTSPPAAATTAYGSRYQSSVTGALPSTLTVADGVVGERPRIHYRYSA